MSIFNATLLTIGIILSIYACFKDIQTKNYIWAVGDIVILPVGMVRAFVHLFGK